ncbi:FAD-binding oxidoreductase [Pseudogemmobacter humi]|uniref:Putative FAD-linked oxidoreductase n=1 Tax=Pseudogemmobacter humi TaxID=2483812 RepID=A0A3P5X3J1_9RHOB|nr:FAD-binding oxidoreductase [Pseudogemmobacter humi]VDC22669.1 putative FAD-linked oxidoreductase [Pseudogemmobacter humi]
MDAERVRARLLEAVGPKGLVNDPAQLRAMSTPWRDSWPSEPLAVVMPGATAEVSAVARICHEEGWPLVPQGGNTGVTGAGLSRPGGRDVLISLKRMNRLRSMDAGDDIMVAEAGCILADLQAAAAAQERFFPMSLGSQGSCTIGGNIATNAGGINALRYGTMRQLVSGLEVVLPDGRVWDGLRKLRKDNTGYDLKHLFIGSEGTLGIITAAALFLSPRPRARCTALVGLESPAMALRWLRRLRHAMGEHLTACELIERICIEVAMRHQPGLRDPLAQPCPWYALVEAGSCDEAAALDERITACFAAALEAGEVLDGVIATSLAQSDALWAMREMLAEGHRHEGISFKHDVSVPVSQVPVFIDQAGEALAARFPGIRQFAFGHIGDGNIHYNSLQAAGEPAADWAPRLPEVNRIVHDIVHRLGGSISAEHGIGQLRRQELPRYKPAVELEMQQRIKAALDPLGQMNPGKLFL